MKAKMTVHGAGYVWTRLRHAADRVKDGARKAMHRGAERIVKEARLNTPVDKHNLEESIRIEKDYTERGRLQIEIVAGGVINGVNVDDYFLEIHEHYEDGGRKPGPNTLAKMKANPGRWIGSGFLRRAVEDNREKIEQHAIDVIKREWKL